MDRVWSHGADADTIQLVSDRLYDKFDIKLDKLGLVLREHQHKWNRLIRQIGADDKYLFQLGTIQESDQDIPSL